MLLVAIGTKGDITVHAAREGNPERSVCGVVPHLKQDPHPDDRVQCRRCLRILAARAVS